MDKQSVRIGVDRFFYAKISSDSESGCEYEPTVALPGVTEIGMALNSAVKPFYADNGIFETYTVDGEKYIQVSFAGLSNEEVANLTGATYSTESGMLIDKNNDFPPYVAVGFRAQKSNGEYRYVWVYKGRFAKADFYNTSKSQQVSPQTDIYIYKFAMRSYDGAWRQTLDSDDENLPDSITNEDLNNRNTGWFSSPNFSFE